MARRELLPLTMILLFGCGVEEPPAPSVPATQSAPVAQQPSLPAAEPTAAWVETWTMAGQVFDALSLETASGGAVVFSSGLGSHRIEIDWDGRFEAEVPALDDRTYLISIEPPEGFDSSVYVGWTGWLAATSAEDRLLMRGRLEMQSGIGQSNRNIEIGLMPLVLSEEQQEARRLMFSDVGY